MGDVEKLTDEQYARWWAETGEHELRQVLFWRWDPIGVDDYFPLAADEYDSYAPGIADLLRRGATDAEIAEHLETIERETMGLGPRSFERRELVAELLMEWFATSIATWTDDGPLRR